MLSTSAVASCALAQRINDAGVATPSFSSADVENRLAGSEFAAAVEYAEQLAAFLSLLAKWNRVYNLTGFRDARRLLDRNLVECLSLGSWLKGVRIADVGTGAGLPGLPLAITEPGLDFTLIESRAKRVHFLRHVVGELGLANVDIAHCRAEDLPMGPAFDTVLARAVAAPLELLTITRHLTAPGSILTLLTSAEKGEEFRELTPDFELQQIQAVGPDGNFGAVVLLERTR